MCTVCTVDLSLSYLLIDLIFAASRGRDGRAFSRSRCFWGGKENMVRPPCTADMDRNSRSICPLIGYWLLWLAIQVVGLCVIRVFFALTPMFCIFLPPPPWSPPPSKNVGPSASGFCLLLRRYICDCVCFL